MFKEDQKYLSFAAAFIGSQLVTGFLSWPDSKQPISSMIKCILRAWLGARWHEEESFCWPGWALERFAMLWKYTKPVPFFLCQSGCRDVVLLYLNWHWKWRSRIGPREHHFWVNTMLNDRAPSKATERFPMGVSSDLMLGNRDVHFAFADESWFLWVWFYKLPTEIKTNLSEMWSSAWY